MALLLLNAAAICSVLVGAHWYLWRRLVKDVSRDGGWWRRTGTVLTALCAAGTVGTLIAGPVGAPTALVRVLAWPGYLTLLVYLTLALLLGEFVRPLLRRGLARRAAPSSGGSNGARTHPGPVRAAPAVPSGPGSGAAHSAAGTGGEDRRGQAPGAEPAGGTGPGRRLFVARTVAVGATTLASALTYAEAMGGRTPSQGPGVPGVEISLPFTGLWRARNSPARRVPSHGTDLYGGRYAIDFIGVDERHRTAGSRSWRTFFATEPPELYFAFGRPILAPGSGTVIAVHDGEHDHEGRRSQLALVPYALGQASRLRRGVPALAGNHVVISLPGSGTFVALAHLKAGSIRVSVGDGVVEGQHIADCGNSGNSTQPHVHMQITDSSNLSAADGVPMLFRRFREWPSGPQQSRVRQRAVPDEDAVVEPLPPSS